MKTTAQFTMKVNALLTNACTPGALISDGGAPEDASRGQARSNKFLAKKGVMGVKLRKIRAILLKHIFSLKFSLRVFAGKI